MRILAITDIHSNEAALRAVLADAEGFGHYDAKYCAGDIVGYGPDPNECVKLVMSNGFTSVLGNHDRAARGGDYDRFNPHAARAALLNRKLVNKGTRAYLAGLSNEPIFDTVRKVAIVHGSFDNSKERYEDEYIDDGAKFPDVISPDGTMMTLRLFGHTHIPTYCHGWFEEVHSYKFYVKLGEYAFDISRPGTHVFFNPGSVGQPRDGNSEAHYGIAELADKEVRLFFRTVPYDIVQTQERMRKKGFPQYLIDRLAVGK